MPILQASLRKTKKLDAQYLAKTKVPLVTVSGTYREDLKGLHHLPENDLAHDVVFSRAHYSMAIGTAVAAWKNKLDPAEAWIVDPTNYVSGKKWSSIVTTELIGKILARYSMLKKLKDLVDKFGRKLPILASITPPLLKLTADIKKPILSFHIAAGNILLEKKKTVFQMITDPHVREDYLANSEKKHAFYGVFDEKTKAEFMDKAKKLNKEVDEHRVIVTGPPIDPRVLEARNHKSPWNTRKPLKICITTGGLGTNKTEIKKILKQLLPELKKNKPHFELTVYAGTQGDIKDMVIDKARKSGVLYTEINPVDPAQFEIGKKVTLKKEIVNHHPNAPLKILYHPQIIDANELLVAFGFPWADIFISKPSGDMAYDAVACGAALLTLAEWGEWEHNIRIKMEGHKVSQVADVDNIVEQLEKITHATPKKSAWVHEAQHIARTIEKQDKYFRVGAKNILKAVKRVGR